MKRALLIMLTLGLAVAVASPAMAVDWSARGFMNIKAAYYKNVDLRSPINLGGPPGTNSLGLGAGSLDPAWNRQSAWVQMRTVLYITARANENLYGTVGFEIDSYRWGTGEGTTFSGGAGRDVGQWNADAVAVEVKNAFIDFKAPFVPVWLRAGIQTILVRPWVFLYMDGAGISARIVFDIDPVTVSINPFWGRILENLDHTAADDQDLYGVDVNVGVGGITGGLFFAYQAQRQLYDGPATEGDSKQWWLGPHLDARFGPFAANFDFVYNGGVEDFQDGTADIDHEGWVLRGVASYTLNKFKFGIGGLYGTGDDIDTNDIEDYRVPFQTQGAATNQDLLIVMGDWGLCCPQGTNNVSGFYKPLSNTGAGVWYVRVFADYQVLSWLKLMANVGYIGDTTTGTFDPRVPGLPADTFGTDWDDDDSIGWEFDVGFQLKVYKNLDLSSVFGYLIGGKALVSMADGDRAQDPWMWVTTLSYAF